MGTISKRVGTEAWSGYYSPVWLKIIDFLLSRPQKHVISKQILEGRFSVDSKINSVFREGANISIPDKNILLREICNHMVVDAIERGWINLIIEIIPPNSPFGN